MGTEDGTERVAVRTYVPAYQRDEWAEHAEELGMSTSEFVRTMVQGGRRDFDLGFGDDTVGEPAVPDADPGDDSLEDRVLAVLEDEGHSSWEDLVAAVTEDVEDRLEAALADLQADNRVTHSPRAGGYRVLEDE